MTLNMLATQPDTLGLNPSLPNRLADILQTAIWEGRLRAGEKLPTEGELSKTYGISRNAVREAIAQLRSASLVETRHGLGTFVKKDISLAINFFASDHGIYKKDELAYIFEFRAHIEAGAAALAALYRSETQLNSLKKALNDLAAAIQSGQSGNEHDVTFHRLLAKASGNPYFVDFMETFHTSVIASIEIARKNSAKRRALPERVQSEHHTIYQAVANKDSVAASEAMRRHIKNAAARLDIVRNL